MTSARLRRAAVWLPSAIALGLAFAPAALSLSVIERADLRVQAIPLDVIQLNPCPPRCSANAYARLHPSVVYKPLEPDEIVFDGSTSLIWGTSAGSEWLLWGRSSGPVVTVWDESMWVEETQIEMRRDGGTQKSQYGVSKKIRIPNLRPKRARGAVAGARRGEKLADTKALELGEVRPELLTPIERGWLANLLEQLSKSQYAVGAVTLGLMALMARLVR